MARVKTLPENRSDLIKVQPFPSGCDDGCPPSPCQFSHTCLRRIRRPTWRAPPCLRSVARQAPPARHGEAAPCDPSAPLFGVNGADAASSCVPPDFRLSSFWPRSARRTISCRYTRRQLILSGIGRVMPAGPQPAFPSSRCRRGDCCSTLRMERLRNLSTPSTDPASPQRLAVYPRAG